MENGSVSGVPKIQSIGFVRLARLNVLFELFSPQIARLGRRELGRKADHLVTKFRKPAQARGSLANDVIFEICIINELEAAKISSLFHPEASSLELADEFHHR
jgi:hypothetical protein